MQTIHRGIDFVLIAIAVLLIRSPLCKLQAAAPAEDVPSAAEQQERSNEAETGQTGEKEPLPDWLSTEDGPKGPSGEGSSLIRQLITSLVFVGILGGGLWFVSKKFSPRMVPSKGGHLKLVESINLGGQKGIHLVLIDGRQTLVVGSTKEGLSLLCEIDEPVEQKKEEVSELGNLS